MKSQWVLALILSVSFLCGIFIIACESGDDDDDDGYDWGDDDTSSDDDDATDDFECSGGACTDHLSGLMWTQDNEFLHGDEISDYCWGISTEGYSDWRAPNISELRSLIRGCNATYIGGSCGVTHSSASRSDQDESCSGCSGYGPSANGEYLPDGMESGGVKLFWTITTAGTDSTSGRKLRWGVSFDEAGVGFDDEGYSGPVFCVRGNLILDDTPDSNGGSDDDDDDDNDDDPPDWCVGYSGSNDCCQKDNPCDLDYNDTCNCMGTCEWEWSDCGEYKCIGYEGDDPCCINSNPCDLYGNGVCDCDGKCKWEFVHDGFTMPDNCD